VVGIEISQIITEYRAQVLINESGQRFVAAFPDDITRPLQTWHQSNASRRFDSGFLRGTLPRSLETILHLREV
jgi:hypothetical protein